MGVWGLPPQRGRTSSALNGSSHYRGLPVPIMEFRIALTLKFFWASQSARRSIPIPLRKHTQSLRYRLQEAYL